MVRVSTLCRPAGFSRSSENVHVAEIGQHQRARDWRCGEHQKVDRLALACQRQPLVHAEAMLLVDDSKREIVEGDLLLKQSMGADHKIDVAGGERSEHVGAVTATLAAGEDRGADAGRGCKRRDGGEMLARQNLGRRHQSRLAAGLDHMGGGKQRHHGFA